MKRVWLFFPFLALLPIFFFQPKEPLEKSKVYDCFLFFNEFELLKMRLTEMDPYVDHFVVVEAKETFRGDLKPLYFQENQDLFQKWRDKIIHVVVEEHMEARKPMERERFQRNHIMQGLKECRDQDIILISDVDEIVDRKQLPILIETLSKRKAKTVLCEQKMYTYFLNHYQSIWPGTVATTFKRLKSQYESKPTRVRHRRSKDHPFVLKQSGWHFSYMGGIEQILKKVAAFSHPECDTPEARQSFAQTCNVNLPHEPIDASFPIYVQENQASFEKNGWILNDK